MARTTYRWDYVGDTLLFEADDTGNITTSYTAEPHEFGAIISEAQEGTSAFYHFDGLGSTGELTDNVGAVLNTYMYTAFGSTFDATEAFNNPFTFQGVAGLYYDAPLDAFYGRSRYLAPSIGRWLSEDPLGFDERVNLFIYANNNPLTFSDPSGLSCIPPLDQCCCCAIRAGFTQCNRWRAGDCGLRGRLFGWSFDLNLTTAWVPSQLAGDCTLEWWEIANIPIDNAPVPGTWVNQMNFPTQQGNIWKDRSKPCFPCPPEAWGVERTKIPDCPVVSFGRKVLPVNYRLVIAIKLVSASRDICPSCPHVLCAAYLACEITTRRAGNGSEPDPRNSRCAPIDSIPPQFMLNYPPGDWPMRAGCQ